MTVAKPLLMRDTVRLFFEIDPNPLVWKTSLNPAREMTVG